MINIKIIKGELTITADNGTQVTFPTDMLLQFATVIQSLTSIHVEGDFIMLEVEIT